MYIKHESEYNIRNPKHKNINYEVKIGKEETKTTNQIEEKWGRFAQNLYKQLINIHKPEFITRKRSLLKISFFTTIIMGTDVNVCYKYDTLNWELILVLFF